ncbi:MAG: hypothetical protein JO353_03185 [Phycisphaerae bacterium]|nr:hypothetical protein [Phycisphaerae bacterium]
MFIDRMINQGAAPVIEQVLKFSSARQKLLADDVANIDTPDYVTKDMSVSKFQNALAERIAGSNGDARGEGLADIDVDENSTKDGILFHDGNNRSVEQLMTDGMKNALTHNLMVELLKRQFATMELALQQK